MPADPTVIIVGPEYNRGIAEWVRQRTPGEPNWGPCTSIGIAIADELVAGVVFNHYQWPTIEASIASTTPRWCSRRNLAAIFAYPFWQLKCHRVGATTGRKNQLVRAFLCRLGFTQEGICRRALPGDDAVIYGMLLEECRWLPARTARPGNQLDVERQGDKHTLYA